MMTNGSRTGFSRWVCGLIVLVVAWLGAGAHAQWSVHAEHPWKSDVATIDIDDLTEQLTLSPEQRAHIEQVLISHREAFEAFAKRGRPLEQQARMRPRGELTEEEAYARRLAAGREMTRMAKQQEQMQKDALAAIAPVLSDAQRVQWRTVRMALHRTWWLEKGSQLAEEEVDLIALLDEIDEHKAAEGAIEFSLWRDHVALHTVMNDWAQQMDHLLLDRRKRYLDYHRKEWERLDMIHRTHSLDADGLENLHDFQRGMARVHKQIRDLNRRYRDIAMSHLSQSDAAALQRAYRAQGWGHQGRNRLPGLTFAEALLDDDTLPEQQRQVISALLDVHRPRAHDLLDRIADAWDESFLLGYDPDKTKHDQAQARAEAHKYAKRFYDLDNALITSVWDALSPQQQARRTKPEPADRRWMNQ